jgi:hypothetical protein
MDFIKFSVWCFVQLVYSVACAFAGAALFLSQGAGVLEKFYDDHRPERFS